MPVIFSEANTIETSHQDLLKAGFRCLNTGTVYEFYIKDGEDNVYLNTKSNVFFRNPKFTDMKKEKIKVIVAGGRDLNNYQLVKETLNKLFRNRTKDEIEIVSGGATGADCWGEFYARENGISKRVFLADWDEYGNAAGPRRNRQMAEYATHCVCFWDGRSRGTKNMIETARKFKLNLRVIIYEEQKTPQ